MTFLGFAAFVWLWSVALARGSYGLAVLAWYGTGRLFLEPLHGEPSIVFGRVRIDRVVAALLALCAGGALALVAAASLPAVRLYDSNPAHLWNRLHASLFVRVTADGREYGADRRSKLTGAEFSERRVTRDRRRQRVTGTFPQTDEPE